MELALTADWKEKMFARNPSLKAKYEAWEQRRDSGKLALWERCMMGEVFPNKIYLPPEHKENAQCELCGDVGYRFYYQDGHEYAEECECFNQVKSRNGMRRAGVNRDMTFDNWVSDHDYQVDMAAKAYEFATGGYLSGQWFFAGGQVGSGKTHICTAILHELIKNNIGCRYMAWRDEAVQLKAIVNNQQEYHARLMELCKAPVLYIDDLWKTQQGQKPTQADVNLAFQIINYRYNDKKYCTIISCESTTKRLREIDEAVESRIYERSKAYRIEIDKDENKNYRLTIG